MHWPFRQALQAKKDDSPRRGVVVDRATNLTAKRVRGIQANFRHCATIVGKISRCLSDVVPPANASQLSASGRHSAALRRRAYLLLCLYVVREFAAPPRISSPLAGETFASWLGR
jgi:hypothetical protein